MIIKKITPVYFFLLLLFSQYSLLAQHYETLIKVSKDGKYGYLDEKGEERIPCIFDKLDNFSEGLVVAKKDSNFYYYNSRGEVVLDLGARYGDCGTFHDSLAVVLGDNSKTFHDPIHFKRGFDIRYIDHSGKEVLKLNEELRIWTDFPASLNFYDGMLALPGYPGLNYSSARVYIGYLNKAGELAIPFLFHSHYGKWQRFSEGLAGASIYEYNNTQKSTHAYGEGGFGYIDEAGKWAIPPRYDIVQSFHCGAALVGMAYGGNSRFRSVKDFKYFYINNKGHFLFADTIYAGIQLRKDSIIGIYQEQPEQRYALAKTNGEFLTDFEFEHLSEGDLWAAKKNGKYGFIDDEGRLVIPHEYEFAYGLKDGLAIVQSKENRRSYTVINERNEVVIPSIPDARYNNYKGIIRQYFIPYHKYRDKAEAYFNGKGEQIVLEGYRLESDPYSGRFQRVMVK